MRTRDALRLTHDAMIDSPGRTTHAGRRMTVSGLRLLLPLLLLAGSAPAFVPVLIAHSVERLPNGNTLISDGGQMAVPTGRALEVDSLGRLVWAYLKCDILWLHTSRRLPNGNTLFTASLADKVLEVTPAGDSVWAYSTGLNYPNEAYRLANGNTLITDRDNNRVIEVDSSGLVVWFYSQLLHPHNGNRLANGNTLVCNSDRDQAIEVNPDGDIVWRCAAELDWPRSMQRLPNGNTLIGDTRHSRVIEVNPAGDIVWSCYGVMPYTAQRLPDGNTLISSSHRVLEVEAGGSTVWQYPPLIPVAVETLLVFNPSSGCSLYVHVHRPGYATSEFRVPGVVLVPGGSGVGTQFDDDGLADNLASDGFAVLHFDPDGRGQSDSFPEDYCGSIQQDGLRACLQELAGREFTDTARLGIFSHSYGVTMASGMIARYPGSPRVKFLLDFEGPADRNQTCRDSGGHVPVSPDSGSFWEQREAARFMKQVPAAYLRLQTVTDHNRRIVDNRHCIQLIDSATSTVHGGAGIAVWTRVNDSAMNEANRVWTVGNPPEWIPEVQELQDLPREILCLRELARLEPASGIGGHQALGLARADRQLRIAPSPARDRVSLTFPRCPRVAVAVFSSAGCCVRRFTANGRAGEATWDGRDASGRSVGSGVYVCRLRSDSGWSLSRQFRIVR